MKTRQWNSASGRGGFWKLAKVEKTQEFSVGHGTLESNWTQRTPSMFGRKQDTNTGDTGDTEVGGRWQNTA